MEVLRLLLLGKALHFDELYLNFPQQCFLISILHLERRPLVGQGVDLLLLLYEGWDKVILELFLLYIGTHGCAGVLTPSFHNLRLA